MQAPSVSSGVTFLALSAIGIGLLDAALVASRRLGAAGAFEYVPARLFAIAPLCWLVVAAIVAIPAYALFRRRGALVTAALLAAMFAGLRLQPRGQWIALAAAAIAFVAAAVIARWWLSRPRRAFGWIAIVALLVCLGGLLVDPREPVGRRTRASGPNVILIFLDTVRYDAIFAPSGDVRAELPTLRRLASESVIYDAAYATSSWTLPSHVSAITGLPSHRLGLDFEHQTYDKPVLTLAERYRRQDYRTAAVISNTFLHPRSGFQRGFDAYDHSGRALDLCRTAPGALLDAHWPWFAASVCNWTAEEVTSRALRRMDGAGPYFLILNFMDAHDPYFTGDVWQWGTLGNDPQRYRARYEPSYRAAIRNIDRQLAAIVARAGRDAVIAVVSDHGEHFGERNLVRHGNSLYPELLRVPLFVRIPGRAAGRVAEPFSLADLPTLLPPAPPAPARPVTASLIPPASFQRPREVSVIRGAWQLIARDNGQEEVIGASPIPPPLLAELRAEAARVRQAMEASRETSFRSLGYVQ